MDNKYQSKERYTISTYVDEMGGGEYYQIMDSTGMIVAIYSPTEFAERYELV